MQNAEGAVRLLMSAHMKSEVKIELSYGEAHGIFALSLTRRPIKGMDWLGVAPP